VNFFGTSFNPAKTYQIDPIAQNASSFSVDAAMIGQGSPSDCGEGQTGRLASPGLAHPFEYPFGFDLDQPTGQLSASTIGSAMTWSSLSWLGLAVSFPIGLRLAR
jgi:hypothetical protein